MKKIKFYDKNWFFVILCIFLPFIALLFMVVKNRFKPVIKVVLVLFLLFWTLFTSTAYYVFLFDSNISFQKRAENVSYISDLPIKEVSGNYSNGIIEVSDSNCTISLLYKDGDFNQMFTNYESGIYNKEATKCIDLGLSVAKTNIADIDNNEYELMKKEIIESNYYTKSVINDKYGYNVVKTIFSLETR